MSLFHEKYTIFVLVKEPLRKQTKYLCILQKISVINHYIKNFYHWKKNVQTREKLLKFKKKKWQKFQQLTLRFSKKKFYDPTSYFLFNFKNSFGKKFKYNLQNKQRLSLFYGLLRKSYLKKVVMLTLKKYKHLNLHATILFIKQLETRLDTALFRSYFSYSFKNARQLISHKKVYVNNKISAA